MEKKGGEGERRIVWDREEGRGREEKGLGCRRRTREREGECGIEKKGEGERRRVWDGEEGRGREEKGVVWRKKRREREKESVG